MSIFQAIRFVGEKNPYDDGATNFLGSRSPPNQRLAIARSYNMNINIDRNVEGFKECAAWQAHYIKTQLKDFMSQIQHLELYHEDKSFYKRKSNADEHSPYEVKTDAKLHWHGYIVFWYDFRGDHLKELFRDIGLKFTVEKRTAHVACHYKKIKDSKHLKDVYRYITKQGNKCSVKKIFHKESYKNI